MDKFKTEARARQALQPICRLDVSRANHGCSSFEHGGWLIAWRVTYSMTRLKRQADGILPPLLLVRTGAERHDDWALL